MSEPKALTNESEDDDSEDDNDPPVTLAEQEQYDKQYEADLKAMEDDTPKIPDEDNFITGV